MTERDKKQAIEEMAKFIKESCAKTPCFQDEKPYTDCDVCAAIYLYSAGYRKQEWISVENPPETYRDEYDELIPFLVCCKGTVYPFRAVYDGTNWGDGIVKLKVTHWMPLPEPPKMKGGEE